MPPEETPDPSDKSPVGRRQGAQTAMSSGLSFAETQSPPPPAGAGTVVEIASGRKNETSCPPRYAHSPRGITLALIGVWR